jgi:flagellar secretion chaperone FliS
MFGSSMNRASAYANVGVETSVNTADPHQLILMLYDGAILAVGSAAIAMKNADIPTKGKSISKAMDIIANGLEASLDPEAGGEIAERLLSLYEYMGDRLLFANLHNDTAALEEVGGLLRQLRDAWSQIGQANHEAMPS